MVGNVLRIWHVPHFPLVFVDMRYYNFLDNRDLRHGLCSQSGTYLLYVLSLNFLNLLWNLNLSDTVQSFFRILVPNSKYQQFTSSLARPAKNLH